MTTENTSAGGGAAVRDIPIDWEALEDAFENNAPEVHSYLHLVTGDVLRVVDGVADPQMHARIAADANYLRIDPVSSREAVPLDGTVHPDQWRIEISRPS